MSGHVTTPAQGMPSSDQPHALAKRARLFLAWVDIWQQVIVAELLYALNRRFSCLYRG